MTEKKEKFYKKRSFWAAVASGVAGVLAGSMGIAEAIGNVITYIVGG